MEPSDQEKGTELLDESLTISTELGMRPHGAGAVQAGDTGGVVPGPLG